MMMLGRSVVLRSSMRRHENIVLTRGVFCQVDMETVERRHESNENCRRKFCRQVEMWDIRELETLLIIHDNAIEPKH